MMNVNQSRTACFWLGALSALIFLLLALANNDALAAPAKRNVNFDHIKTGFPLSGAHATLPCETCHVQGIFKGTPKKCATCHTRGSRIQASTFKPANHVVTNQACDQCHTSTASWNVAFFSHVGVIAHQCGQCHNGSVAKGKPANHVQTTAACDACHRTTTWANASFTHFGIAPGSCETCHRQGGAASTFKSSNHIPTSLACDACHTAGGTFAASKFTHSATQGVIAGQCATCHSGAHEASANAKGKPPGHVATTASCDTCHTGFVSFALGGSKPADHIPTNLACSACHTAGNYTTSTFTHSATQGIMVGQCATCHNGAYAKWNAQGKPANHIPTNLSCDACHTTGGTSFKPSKFVHASTQGVLPLQCTTCHNGTYTSSGALGKHPTHIVTTASCDTCHSGYVSFVMSGTAFNHAGVTPGSCASCHVQGGSATAKPTNHIPTNLSCDACHSTGGTFATSSFTHSATQGIIAGQCTSCHNGAYSQWNAQGKSPNHIPTNLSCDACHMASAGTFTSSTFAHSATQGVIAGQCSTCHNGAYTQSGALGKHATHVATTASCDNCHKSYTTFTGAMFNHTSVLPGSCASCHNGSQARGKSATHLPTSLSCDACHNTTTFIPSTFTHSATQGVTPGSCATCHNGIYAPGKPGNHIPYESQLLAGGSMNCDSCHKSTTSFITLTMNHNNSQGNGSGWCKGCHMSGTPFAGNMDKKSLSHYERYQGQTDCSQSGCHRPLGNQGTPYTRWTN